MPQINLPIIAEGVTNISATLGYKLEDDQVHYFNGLMPVFVHDKEDIQTFKMITAQFCANGVVKQMDIVRAFGVTKISVKRAVKKYREEGPSGFYRQARTRGATVLTSEVLAQAQQLLNTGQEPKAVAEELNILANTLTKAI